MAINPAEAAVVSACSGVSLPKSVVTDIVGQAVVPVAGILDNALGLITGPLGLSTNLSNTLASIAAGNPVTLNVLDVNGQVVNQGAPCASTADSFELTTPKGISIGGNKITGLGANTIANAGELNSIAFGNNATTSATATNSIAIGPNASIGASGVNSVALGSGSSATAANSVALGAGSTATTGAQAGYTAYALTAPQTSVGEVSVGSPGNLRKITNVAPGSAANDAVTVSQLQAVNDGAVKYDNPINKMTVTLGAPLSIDGGATNGTTITNLHQGALGPTSTDAVNGSQLYATNVRIDNLKTGTTKYFNANSTAADSLAGGAESVAIGPRSVASGTSSFAAGDFATASGNGSVAIGMNSSSTGLNSIAIGTGAIATGSVAVGAGAQAGNGGAAFGDNAVALTPQQGTAIGNGASVTANRGVALGAGSQATRAGMNGAVEKYSGVAVTSTQGAVSVGSAGNERQITNVAGGTAPTDAVNVRQLDYVMSQTNTGINNQINTLQSEIGDVRRDANAGSASAMAMASMPQSAYPGRSMIAAGMATYDGQSALSIGVSKLSDNGRWVFKFGGSTNTRGNVGAGAGVGFHF